MDTLWATLRTPARATFVGQFLQEIELEDNKLLPEAKQMKGRQMCWRLRERSNADRHQGMYKQQEVHHHFYFLVPVVVHHTQSLSTHPCVTTTTTTKKPSVPTPTIIVVHNNNNDAVVGSSTNNVIPVGA